VLSSDSTTTIFDYDGKVMSMTDVFDFTAPWGFLGKIAETAFLISYMKGFLDPRAAVIKEVAESDEWQRFLPPT
jgi:hypothetical protein